MLQAVESEVARVRHHIRGAERLLETRDVRALSPLQRLTRNLLRSALAEYRDAGRFPQNREYSVMVPSFIDADGTRCAMAHLMELGGASALVTEVATHNNFAYVRELAKDARVVAWLDAAGLTVGEAARIQPTYPPFYLCRTPLEALCVASPGGGNVARAPIASGGAVVEAVITVEDQREKQIGEVRIERVHGTPAGIYKKTLDVGATATVLGWKAVPVGTRVLVAEDPANGESFRLTLVAILDDADNVTLPPSEIVGQGPLRKDLAIAARVLGETECKAYLTALDPCWGAAGGQCIENPDGSVQGGDSKPYPEKSTCKYGPLPAPAPVAASADGGVMIGAGDAGASTPGAAAPTTDDASSSCMTTRVGTASPSDAGVLLAVVAVLLARRASR